MKFLDSILFCLSAICFSSICSMEIPAEWVIPDRKPKFPFALQHGSGCPGGTGPKIFGEFIGELIEKAGVIIADKQKIERPEDTDVSNASVLTLEDTRCVSPWSLTTFINSRKDFFRGMS